MCSLQESTFVRGLLGFVEVLGIVGFAAVATPKSSQFSFAMIEGSICASTETQSEVSDEASYLIANGAAMRKMMSDMAVKPAGNIDVDFVSMMSAHHQGAIEMAQAVLRYGQNQQIRRLAQEIIVTQQQEIAAMRLAIGRPAPKQVANSFAGP
jgi:hypothetical protein